MGAFAGIGGTIRSQPQLPQSLQNNSVLPPAQPKVFVSFGYAGVFDPATDDFIGSSNVHFERLIGVSCRALQTIRRGLDPKGDAIEASTFSGAPRFAFRRAFDLELRPHTKLHCATEKVYRPWRVAEPT